MRIDPPLSSLPSDDGRLGQMVSKMEKDTVIILYKKGLSIRKIAADTLLARNTVKKYIREYLAAESELAAASTKPESSAR